ncbi:MFS transporter [Nonomuraea wenchangensis]|uniref:MFS transporter n=1 Tax=Nonomuraea wenchangensis TaxID=568860 RepID=UPI003433BC83
MAATALPRPLAGVLAAVAVSLTGTRVSAIAVPWFVLVTTGSPVWTGVVAFAEMAPYVAVKLMAGPLLDRIGPRRVSLAGDVVSAGAAGTIALLHALSLLPLGVLAGLVAVIGAARGPGDLAKSIMVPEAADLGRVPLERATGLMGVVERLAQLVGPIAGGAMVAALGAPAGLAVSAVCFALGSVVVAWALPHGMGRRAAAPSAPSAPSAQSAQEDGPDGYWRRFGQGWAFLRGQPLLLVLICTVAVTNLLDAAFAQVLGPVWAEGSGNGPAVWGLSRGFMGLTAIGGGLVAAALAHRLRRRPVFFAAFLVAGPPQYLILAVDGVPVWAVLVVFGVGGFCGGFLNPILGAVTYERVPRDLLGRVGALQTSLAFSGIPVAGVLAGAAVAAAGLAPVLVACGVVYGLTTTLAGLHPAARDMDRLRGQGPRASDAVPEPAGGT